MAMTSQEIAAIIGQQQQQFSAQHGYAQASTGAYGTAPISVDQGIQAAGIGGYTSKLPGMAMGSIGLAAAFGHAPAVLDPFTAMGSFAATGLRSRGIPGMLGYGAAGFALGSAIQAPIQYGLENMVQGAEGRGLLNAQLGAMLPSMRASQLGGLSGSIMNMSRAGYGSVNDLTSIMGQAGPTMLDTSSTASLGVSFQSLMETVRQSSQILSVSTGEGFQALSTMRQAGLNNGQSLQAMGALRAMGTGAGMSPAQMMEQMSMGMQFAQNSGTDAYAGGIGMATNAAMTNYAGTRGGIRGIRGDTSDKMLSGSMRFFNGRAGQNVLAAMMSSDGSIDESVANRVAAGTITKKEIETLSAEHLKGVGRDTFSSRSGELSAQFVSQYGPAAAMGGVKAMAEGSKMQDTLMQMMTGLNRSDLSVMDQLASNSGMLKARMMEEARSGMQAGTGRRSLGDIVSKIFEPITKAIRDKSQKIGESWTQAIQETIESIGDEFMGAKDPTAIGTGGLTSMRQLAASGQKIGNLAKFDSALGNSNAAFNMFGVHKTGDSFGSQLANMSPSSFRMASMGEGTSMSELPMYGMGTMTHSDAMSGVAATAGLSRVTAGLASRSIIGGVGGASAALEASAAGGFLGGVGSMVGSAGKGLGNLAGEISRPAANAFSRQWFANGIDMMAGGRGVLTGTTKLAGGVTRLAGAGIRGLGRLAAGPLGLAWAGADLLSNELPALMRGAGMSEITDGAISGGMADVLRGNEAELFSKRISTRRSLGGTGDFGNDIPVTGSFRVDQQRGTREFAQQLHLGEATLGLDDNSQMAIYDPAKFAEWMGDQRKQANSIAARVGIADTAAFNNVLRSTAAGSTDQLVGATKYIQDRLGDRVTANEARVMATAAIASKGVIRSQQDVDRVGRDIAKNMSGALKDFGVTTVTTPERFDRRTGEVIGGTTRLAGESGVIERMAGNDVEFLGRLSKTLGGIGNVRGDVSMEKARNAVGAFFDTENIKFDSDTARANEINRIAAGGFGVGGSQAEMEAIQKAGGGSVAGSLISQVLSGTDNATRAYQYGKYKEDYTETAGSVKSTLATAFYSAGMNGGKVSAAYGSFVQKFGEGTDIGGAFTGLDDALLSASADANPEALSRMADNLMRKAGAEDNAVARNQITSMASIMQTKAQVKVVASKNKGKDKASSLVAGLLGESSTFFDKSLQEYATGSRNSISTTASARMQSAISDQFGTTGDATTDIQLKMMELARAQGTGAGATLIEKLQNDLVKSTASYKGGSGSGPASKEAEFNKNIESVNAGLDKLAKKLGELPE